VNEATLTTTDVCFKYEVKDLNAALKKLQATLDETERTANDAKELGNMTMQALKTS